MAIPWRRAARALASLLGAAATTRTDRRSPSRRPAPTSPSPDTPINPYAGDASGPVHTEYAPVTDGRPDPGEVVWAWVPYEEDHSRGKDRPVLVVGREGDLLLAVPLTSKDHDRDHAQEAAAGRFWIDVGTGDWDRRHRPSEARVDRVLRLRLQDVRRSGAVLDRAVFDHVAAAIADHRDR